MYNVKGTHHLIWQASQLIWQRRIVAKVTAQFYVNGVIVILCKYLLAICSAQDPAGRRINFSGLVFASKAILRQNTSHAAVSRLFYPFH